MNRLLPLFGLLLLAMPAAGQQKVTASLVSDATEIQPGKPIIVAVRLTIAPGFHVYWVNPGDSGSATAVRWTLPEGFSAGPLQFPAPHQFHLPGGLVNYGYENEVWLLTTITPSQAVDKPIEISADVRWLVCDEDSCRPGRAPELKLRLPVDSPEDAPAIEHWKKQLPVPAERGEDVKRVSAAGSGAEIEWTNVPKNIQFFPPADDHWTIEDATVKTSGKVTRVQYRLKANSAAAQSHSPQPPVLAYTRADGGRRAVELPVAAKPSNP